MNISIKWTKRLGALAACLGLSMPAGAGTVQTVPGSTVSFGIQNGQVSIREGGIDPTASTQFGITNDFFLMTGPFNSFSFVSSVPTLRLLGVKPVVSTLPDGFIVDLNDASYRVSGGIPLGTGLVGGTNLPDCCFVDFYARMHGVEFLPDAGYRVDHYALTMRGHAFAQGGAQSLSASISTCAVLDFRSAQYNCSGNSSIGSQLVRDGLGRPWVADGSFLYSAAFSELGDETVFFWQVSENMAHVYPGGFWSIEMDQISVRAVLVPVPEPSSLALMALAGLGLALRVRMRR